MKRALIVGLIAGSVLVAFMLTPEAKDGVRTYTSDAPAFTPYDGKGGYDNGARWYRENGQYEKSGLRLAIDRRLHWLGLI